MASSCGLASDAPGSPIRGRTLPVTALAREPGPSVAARSRRAGVVAQVDLGLAPGIAVVTIGAPDRRVGDAPFAGISGDDHEPAFGPEATSLLQEIDAL